MKNNPTKKTNTKDYFRLQLIVICCLGFILYFNTLFNDYSLDDTLMVTKNKFTTMGIHGIGKIMSNDAFVGFFGENKNLLPGGRYRPLSQVVFALEYQFFGLNPFIGHLVNILFYTLLCGMIFILLNNLFKSYTGNKWYLTLPFIIAALFTAHPLHTEAVANIKGLDESIGLFLTMATLFFSIKFTEDKNYLYLAIIPAIFLLALLTKENAITFLAVIPVTLYVFKKTTVKDYVLIMSSLVFASVIYFYIRYKSLGFVFSNNAFEKELLNNPFINTNNADRFATIMLTWGKYLQLLILPYNLTHDYYPKQIPIITWGDLRAILPLLIYAALLFYALYTIIKNKFSNNRISKFPNYIIAYGILFFFITFSIQSNIVFNIGTFMNERFMFVSLFGFCIVVGFLLHKYHFKYNSAVTTILLVIMLLYSVKTISRNMVWKDDFTLFTTDVNTSSNSAKCNVSAGGMYYEKAKEEKDSVKKNNMLMSSISYLNRGLEIHPQYVAGWILLGNAYLELKDYRSARINYENVLNISAGHKDAMNNLLYVAQTTDKNNLLKESIASFKTLLRYNPKDDDYLYQYASVIAKAGRTDTALVILNKMIADKPNSYNAYNKLGEIYGRYLNDMNKSLVYLDKAYSIKPGDASVLENIGVANGIMGRYEKSIEYFNKAIAAKPADAQLYNNIANSYRSLGNIEMADKSVAKANELKAKEAKK